MKKIIAIAVLSVSLFSCSKSVNKQDLKYLNGFWEIEKVKNADGVETDYKINLTVDNFELDSLKLDKGLRKKGMPQFDGKYLTNGIEEKFSISDSLGVIKLNYITDYAKWSEQVLEITPTTFVVINENEVTYFYKKYEAINIEK